jgi:hypothetical protein
MSLVLLDRVRETTTTTGSGTLTLDGAVTGFQGFSALGNGNTTYYTIQGTTQWEVGIGTFTAGTLSRDTVISSSAGGAKLTLTDGTKDVFVTLPAEKTITSIASANGSVTVTQTGSEVNLSAAIGDVVGPASATNHAIARFDGTTGKLIQNSGVTIDDSANVASARSLQFSGATPSTLPIGTLWFDSATDTLNFKQNNITQQVGEELFIYGRADADIVDGQVIYVTGSWGTTGVVTFAPTPIGLTDPSKIIGLATEAITKNAFGRITVFGTVHDLSTSPGFADGDVLWYDPTVVGGYTKTQPSAPNIKCQVGIVTKAAGGANGSIAVKVIAGSSLGGTDSNVKFTSLANNDLIQYDSSLQYWKNVPAATAGLVTSVSGTSPVASSGGATPAISLSSAYGDTLNPYAVKTAKYFLAAPNGADGVPVFRLIVASDIPTLNQNTTGTASNVTGTVAVANGGTGGTTAADARTNLTAAKSGANTDITSVGLTTGTISTAPSAATDIVNKTYADGLTAKWGA